ncbi:MAG: Rne/Rng family ribonuclease [Actinobacteria bacterium]|nr:Rne/Rng family ribonuclease [Actinomycetota bacterium]
MSDDLREGRPASATPDAARDDAAPTTTGGPTRSNGPAAENAGPATDVQAEGTAEGSAQNSATGSTRSANGDSAAGDDDGAPRRRRRRGSRGGRNRRKPSSAAAGDDYHDTRVDRGLTTEDLAADALEEAGLRTPPAGEVAHGGEEPARPRAAAEVESSRPKIGDTRPAPDAPAPSSPAAAVHRPSGNGDAATTPARRRRRGGRGRGKNANAAATGTGSQGARTTTREATRPRPSKPVVADLGVDEGGVDLDELDEETLERRRGRTRKGRPTGRYMMCVHATPGQATQLAVLEGRHLVEHYVSRPEDDDTSIDGNIYLGRVQNVLPGMEAAFVDIGTPKNGVIYRSDVAFDEAEVDEKQPRIERLLKNGQSVMVQVTKNPIGAKGARLTQEVSLAGRFVVMVPGHPDTYGISKRLPDDERKRLRRILEGLRPPDAGLIVRTAAEGASADELERDMRRLKSQWEQISGAAARSRPPVLLYKEPPMAVRVIREEFTKEYRAVVIDDRALYDDVRSYVEAIAPELAERIEFYDEAEEQLPLFERYHVHEQLVKALDRKVWLPSGGSLVIERTEALTVIDVNTGKNVGRSNLEETVFRNNLEAAEEVARQLRLRDIGGIIVIDFIDMEIKQNREEVLHAFKDALARDKTRTQVFDISELGLVEMTRKRISEGLVEAFSETCEVCHGRGFVVDESLLG